MWFWDWHFYHWKNYILNFKNPLSLSLRDTLKRTPKVISNQNLFSRFQSWCWSWCLNFVSKNQAILLALKILGLQGFSLQPVWVSVPPISQRVTTSFSRTSNHIQKFNFIPQCFCEILWFKESWGIILRFLDHNSRTRFLQTCSFGKKYKKNIGTSC